ncbi:hypothetical protein [Arthrobacter sp. zg-Y1110]|uniref:hypothetical protein n=1 Tax=Arthrobacter sp. zg-Y1110 TaxID=2886932 RepID=UPI001D15CB67|nr:hypothetical protein [Arthrobacter sp. zg-Y1110]MCC3292924.1 hypothetical protein [Arthrobacter sp. zg-Y1110]UWX86863.1 hypothetical protein N2K99_18645 [Arthrobacter sp. zg-Y1110]
MSAAALPEPVAARPPEPLSSLHDTVTFSSNDWASAPDFAWIYGITVGWDGRSMLELAGRFGWSGEKIVRLRRLRRAYRRLQLEEERRSAASAAEGKEHLS